MKEGMSKEGTPSSIITTRRNLNKINKIGRMPLEA
jgi:hypothetical protein